ncbi:hypothetical protein KSC_095420 [Ktedonobacter sp. SOSP1-52]|nr:hypothetical protein KSC_095420 [Ktedonobacter sp. SOSP1-52]
MQGVNSGLGAVGKVQLGENIADMCADRGFAEGSAGISEKAEIDSTFCGDSVVL